MGYSALVSTFLRSIIAKGGGKGGRASSRGRGHAPRGDRGGGGTGNSSLDAFRDRYPMDDRAFAQLERSSPHIQNLVMQDFRVKREGEADYSALVMAFVRAVQARVSGPETGDRPRSRG